MPEFQIFAKHAGLWKYGLPWVRSASNPLNGTYPWGLAKMVQVRRDQIAISENGPISVPASFVAYRDLTPPGYSQNTTLVSVRNGAFTYFYDYNSLAAGAYYVMAALFRGYGPYRFQWTFLDGSGVSIAGGDSGFITNKFHEVQVNGTAGGYGTVRCQITNYWGGIYDDVILPTMFFV